MPKCCFAWKAAFREHLSVRRARAPDRSGALLYFGGCLEGRPRQLEAGTGWPGGPGISDHGGGSGGGADTGGRRIRRDSGPAADDQQLRRAPGRKRRLEGGDLHRRHHRAAGSGRPGSQRHERDLPAHGPDPRRVPHCARRYGPRHRIAPDIGGDGQRGVRPDYLPSPASVTAGTQYSIVALNDSVRFSGWFWYSGQAAPDSAYVGGKLYGVMNGTGDRPLGRRQPPGRLRVQDLRRAASAPGPWRRERYLPTGERAAALKKCKKKRSKKAKKKCKKKATPAARSEAGRESSAAVPLWYRPLRPVCPGPFQNPGRNGPSGRSRKHLTPESARLGGRKVAGSNPVAPTK